MQRRVLFTVLAAVLVAGCATSETTCNRIYTDSLTRSLALAHNRRFEDSAVGATAGLLNATPDSQKRFRSGLARIEPPVPPPSGRWDSWYNRSFCTESHAQR